MSQAWANLNEDEVMTIDESLRVYVIDYFGYILGVVWGVIELVLCCLQSCLEYWDRFGVI